MLVVGDLFDAAAPPPEAERIVYQALLELSAGGARPVVVVAGNHDNAARLAAVAPVFAAHGVQILDKPSAPADGGVVLVETAAGPARLALLPFLSQRGVVTADELMAQRARPSTGRPTPTGCSASSATLADGVRRRRRQRRRSPTSW